MSNIVSYAFKMFSEITRNSSGKIQADRVNYGYDGLNAVVTYGEDGQKYQITIKPIGDE